MHKLNILLLCTCVFLITTINSSAQPGLFVRNINQRDQLCYVDSTGYYFKGSGPNRLYKTDTNGTPLWAKSYGIIDGMKVLHLKNSDFLLCSRIIGNATFGFQLMRVDSQGAIIWEKEYLSLLSNQFPDFSVVEDEQSNLFLSCIADPSILEMLKLDSTGNLLMSKKLTFTSPDISYDGKNLLLSKSNGNIVVFCKAYWLPGDFTSIIEFDNNLSAILNQTNFIDIDIFSAFEHNNSIYLTTSVEPPYGQKLFQIDSSLNFVKGISFPTPSGSSTGLSVSITSKSEFLVCHESIIMLLDSLFQSVWIKQIDQTHNLSSIHKFYAFETPEKDIACSFAEINNGPIYSTTFSKLDSLGNSACSFVSGGITLYPYSIMNAINDTLVLDTTLFGSVTDTIYGSSNIIIPSYYICSTSIEDKAGGENDISLYPNPFNSGVEIAIENSLLHNSEKKQLFVYNSIGELVLSEDNLISKMRIDMNESTSGIYFVRILIGDKQFVRKIVKE